MSDPTLAIIGTVGVPARYGGFETLTQQLILAAEARGFSDQITVYGSAQSCPRPHPDRFHGAHLRYLPLRANGAQSIPYDMLSLFGAALAQADHALVLGVSGALAIPAVRAVSRTQITVHLDGIEWKRAKWSSPTRHALQSLERIAARSADQVLADNPAIADHVQRTYGRKAHLVSYGGDASTDVVPADVADLGLPPDYALAITRVEPENNLHLILEAFAALPDHPLVVVGYWRDSAYAYDLRRRYGHLLNIHLLGAEYDPARLKALRAGASLYLHGHSVGGTNPSLVEMMPFGVPIATFDCAFNRATTGNLAACFDSAASLARLVPRLTGPRSNTAMGAQLAALAARRYRWRDVATEYFKILGLGTAPSPAAWVRL